MKGDLAARERSRRRSGDAGRAGEEGMRGDDVKDGRESRRGQGVLRAAFLQPLADEHGRSGAVRSAEAEAAAAKLLI
ncbi:hypothetical protein C5F48_11525 [Cereibacter changlensis JA139]|uniref:Uncharacterized protein n=2 Tax=Cereibacter changlensis TaxID=402884 RepID=A0A2T4JUM3_9RHOB|nr:hypothetical protein C5F48_11525 [Cereibacter changlensis JA139]